MYLKRCAFCNFWKLSSVDKNYTTFGNHGAQIFYILIFGLFVLSSTEKGVLKTITIIMRFYIYLFCFIKFYFTCFDIILYGYKLKFAISSGLIKHFIIIKISSIFSLKFNCFWLTAPSISFVWYFHNTWISMLLNNFIYFFY